MLETNYRLIILLRKGVVAWATLFLSFNTTMLVAGEYRVKELTSRSEELVLAKERQKAAELLNQELQSTNFSSQEKKEILKNLQQIGRLFLTEKAQKDFEYGQSLLFSEKTQEAIEAFSLALETEPANISIRLGLARAHLAIEQCGSAEKVLRPATQLNPHEEEVKLLLARSYLCQGNQEALKKEFLIRLPVKAGSSHSLEWALLFLESCQKQSGPQNCQDPRNYVGNKTTDHPMLDYLVWSYSQSQEKPSWESAQAYLKKCENLTLEKRRRFKNHPLLCKHKSEVRIALKDRDGGTN